MGKLRGWGRYDDRSAPKARPVRGDTLRPDALPESLTVSDTDTPAGPPDDPRPQPPPAPDPSECCGDGCAPCIYDTYDEAVAYYRSALAAWKARHPEA
ncbi:hypothetical protein PCA_00700 [Rhodanobacter sp. PCA2]|nr:hypothetical protein [Rhodanobacter sp. PCA2]